MRAPLLIVPLKKDLLQNKVTPSTVIGTKEYMDSNIKNGQNDPHLILVNALIDRVPIVTVLGASFGWPGAENDPVLVQTLNKAGRSGGAWNSLVGKEPVDGSLYTWVAERYARRSPSESMQLVADIPVSAVFTSSVDGNLSNIFSTNGRQAEQILIGYPAPAEIRSTRRPPVFHLFGRAGGGVADLDPPKSRAELSVRRSKHASSMLLNLTESATALGLILIDGYEPDKDWLRAEDLLSLLSSAPVGGVIWYGANPNFTNDDDFDYFESLVSSNVIVRDQRALAEAYAIAQQSGHVPAEQHWDEPELITLAHGLDFVVTPRLRLATEAVASIIDNSWTGFLPPFSESLNRVGFQSFHGANIGEKALVEGVRRGYAIKREFEGSIYAKVARALNRHHEQKDAIIIHGQSGVGKTIALGRLAVAARENERVAVLMVSVQRIPQPAEISPFLEAMGKVSMVTLILIDANLPCHRYDELLHALKSSGHKVVIVGTSYRLDSTASHHIYAPAALSPEEQSSLTQLAGPYVNKDSSFDIGSDHALARFYWSLPDSRNGIADGLSREIRVTETALRIKGEKQRPRQNLSSLGLALVKAGYSKATDSLFDDSYLEDDAEYSSPSAKVIDYVMAVSRLYKSVPINLLLRTVLSCENTNSDRIDLEIIRDLFEGQDIFRWSYGGRDESELLISSRLQIEAVLVCNRRLGSASTEAQYILDLLSNATRAGSEDSEEAHFAVDVVYAMGADGPLGERYKDSYLEIARCLTYLRVKKGVYNARLMLQESTLRRAYVKGLDFEIGLDEKTIILAEASKAINEAFEAIDANGPRKLYVAKRTREYLYTERAATYGFIAIDSASKKDEVWTSYCAAREAVRVAIGKAFSYQPLDIALWAPIGVLKKATDLSDLQQAEIRADIRATLDLVDPTGLGKKEKILYDKQKLNSGDVLGDQALSDEAFASLENSGSSLGYLTRARTMAPVRPDDIQQVKDHDLERAMDTLKYLENARTKVDFDYRTLQLLLSMQWLISTRNWLFRGFRQPLPHDPDVRERIKNIIFELQSIEGNNSSPQMRYLAAVFLWLCGEPRAAIFAWRELARDTEYIESRRIVLRHTISDSNGKPVIFSGHLVKPISPGRWSVKVEGLNHEVDLQESDFPGKDFALGKSIRQFSISFNYRGPIADPFHVRNS